MQPQLPDPVFINLEYIFFLVYRVVSRFFNFLFGDNGFERIKILATLIVIVLITIILYCLVRLYEIQKESKAPVSSEIPVSEGGTSSVVGAMIEKKNDTWEAIRRKVLSDNQSDWRLGIIEADIYLDRVLDQQGIFGDTLGDKLKSITEARLPSLQLAWEAHKVRNRIAHEGAEYTLTQPEARRALSYFEIVFRDLEVIA